MDKFEDAWKENRHVWESSKNLAKAMYLAGQQSRQTEVDALKNLLEEDEHAHNLYCENANLQTLVEEKDKRINQALNFINNWWHPDLDQKLFVEALGRALRGERE